MAANVPLAVTWTDEDASHVADYYVCPGDLTCITTHETSTVVSFADPNGSSLDFNNSCTVHLTKAP